MTAQQQLPSRKEQAIAIRKQAEALLDEVLEMELRLSDQDSEYSYIYLGEKLTKVSFFLEKLGNISIKLAKVSLEVIRQTHELDSLSNLKERSFKDSQDYQNEERADRADWLAKQMAVLRGEAGEWRLTQAVMKEIRAAVDERIQLFKRLDSDLRLQTKLLEAKLEAGAGSTGEPPKDPRNTDPVKGADVDELEIS